MQLTKNELLLVNDIFTKVKYDKLNDRYTISLEDYAFLNLYGSQQKLQ